MTKKRSLVSFDWAIKRLLRSKANFVILEGFLSELLKENIKILSLQKTNRLDLKVANHKNEIVIIEIQYEREYDYFFRMLFDSSKVVCEHLSLGEPYLKVVKVISINILYFDLGHGTDYIYHGKTVFTGLNDHDELALSSEQRKMFNYTSPCEIFPEYYLIKVNNFNDVAKNTLDEWVYFLKNEEIRPDFTGKGLREAKKALDVMKLSEAERQAYERYSDDLHYQASMLDSSYGLGKIEGREEGRGEGREEGIVLVAKNLLQMGQSIENVSKATGLAPERIKKLADQNRVAEPVTPYGLARPARKPRKSSKAK